jgi:hypothetical protein
MTATMTMTRDGVLTINGVPVGPLFGGTAPNNAQYGIVTSGELRGEHI